MTTFCFCRQPQRITLQTNISNVFEFTIMLQNLSEESKILLIRELDSSAICNAFGKRPKERRGFIHYEWVLTCKQILTMSLNFWPHNTNVSQRKFYFTWNKLVNWKLIFPWDAFPAISHTKCLFPLFSFLVCISFPLRLPRQYTGFRL